MPVQGVSVIGKEPLAAGRCMTQEEDVDRTPGNRWHGTSDTIDSPERSVDRRYPSTIEFLNTLTTDVKHSACDGCVAARSLEPRTARLLDVQQMSCCNRPVEGVAVESLLQKQREVFVRCDNNLERALTLGRRNPIGRELTRCAFGPHALGERRRDVQHELIAGRGDEDANGWSWHEARV